jgi:hypothetical protein
MNDLIKINIHSFVDIITNSSTTIFSYYGGCIKPAKEMIDEFLKLAGTNLKTDDVFYIDVFADIDTYISYAEDLDEEDVDGELMALVNLGYKENHNVFDAIIKSILNGERQKPQWMSDAEKHEDYDGYIPSNSLYIMAKDVKYDKLATLINNFITSSEHEISYNG